MTKPVVWTIAGSDSGGGAGIQADLATFQDLGVHGCTVITAITAQNSVAVSHITYASAEIINAQLSALHTDLPAHVIKIGMLGCVEVIKRIARFLPQYTGTVIYDPVMVSTSGHSLLDDEAQQAVRDLILPQVDLLTPNRMEAAALVAGPCDSADNVAAAARQLQALGVKSVLIKGGHSSGDYCQDYYCDGNQQFWLSSDKQQHNNTHGSGCTLAAAVSACLAHGYNMMDALVIAKMYVTEGIRHASQIGHGPGPVCHLGWPEQGIDLPWLTTTAAQGQARFNFLACIRPIGFYPIVDSVAWLEKCIASGVKSIQLRIKGKTGDALVQEIKQGIEIANRAGAQLYINDYWQLAIDYRAYGVHLGQQDLSSADLDAIAAAGLRLGISTHSYAEMARAHALKPSYIAIGPIFHTNSKKMDFPPQGLDTLKRWRRMLPYPVVAIGGINSGNAAEVAESGVDGIAVIAAVTQAEDPAGAIRDFLRLFQEVSG